MAKIYSSLIITVKNDAEALQLLLQDIEAQTQLPDEVVLTIAPSSDDTLRVAQNWQPKHIRTTVLELPRNSTRSTGRNSGVAQAQGRILCFTDAGCRLSSSWMEKILHAFSLPETKLVSGHTTSTLATPQEEVQGAFTLVSAERIGTHPLPATRNMAVRREAFETIGPFREELNYAEDFEWSRRAKRKGYVATFVSEAKVLWKPRESWIAFWIMIFRLTQGDMMASTWRRGHLSMIFRYLIFVLCAAYIIARTESLWWGVCTFVFVWLIYIGVKMKRFHFFHARSYILTPGAQALTDTAVISGIVIGLLKKGWNTVQPRKTLHA